MYMQVLTVQYVEDLFICHFYNSSNITNDDIVLDLARDT